MNKRTRIWVNLAAAAVIVVVLGWLGYTAMHRVRSVDISVTPSTLPPDGRSEALVEVRLKNLFGLDAWEQRTMRFEIVEGQDSGTIVASAPRSARIRSTLQPGRIVVYISIQGNPLPYEVTIPVRPNYAVRYPAGERQ